MGSDKPAITAKRKPTPKKGGGSSKAPAAKNSKADKKKEEKPKRKTCAQILDEIGEEVIMARIANCEFISNIAKSYGVSETQFHAWLDARPELYMRARERQADKLVADMIQIADDGMNDTYVDEKGNVQVNQDVVARSRLRIDARKWLASKMNSKKYGDKLEVETQMKVVTVKDLRGRQTD